METCRQWGPEDELEDDVRVLTGPEDEPQDDPIEDLDPTIDRRLALEFDPLS